MSGYALAMLIHFHEASSESEAREWAEYIIEEWYQDGVLGCDDKGYVDEEIPPIWAKTDPEAFLKRLDYLFDLRKAALAGYIKCARRELAEDGMRFDTIDLLKNGTDMAGHYLKRAGSIMTGSRMPAMVSYDDEEYVACGPAECYREKVMMNPERYWLVEVVVG